MNFAATLSQAPTFAPKNFDFYPEWYFGHSIQSLEVTAPTYVMPEIGCVRATSSSKSDLRDEGRDPSGLESPSL